VFVLEFFDQLHPFAHKALANENAAYKTPVCSKIVIKSDFQAHKLKWQGGGQRYLIFGLRKTFFYIPPCSLPITCARGLVCIAMKLKDHQQNFENRQSDYPLMKRATAKYLKKCSPLIF